MQSAIGAPTSVVQLALPAPITEHERGFIDKIKSYHQINRYYYDRRVVDKVRQCVPWQEMTIQCVSQFMQLKAEQPDIKLSSEDLLLIELVRWFKNEFFSWFDAGHCATQSCPNYTKPMQAVNRSVQPSMEDLAYGASRIELYECPSCRSTTRFPRYNHPLKLLETRKGRCGEWANTLTCILIVLGYDARLVLDWTDHVWTEVFNKAQQRWVHCDSCENGIDSPMTYEAGWGKKLTYCVAISRFDVQDVTWRYTNNFAEVLQRRSLLCREQFVRKVIIEFNRAIRSALPPEQRKELLERTVRELVELLWSPGKQKALSEAEQQGRQSGSQAWRMARDELGKPRPCKVGYVFKPQPSEFDGNNYSISYNSVRDEYSHGKNTTKGWQKAVYSYENIAKKVEHDWQMVYLARVEGSAAERSGEVCWRVSLQGLDWQELSVIVNGKNHEDSEIAIQVHSLPQGCPKQAQLNEQLLITRSEVGDDADMIEIKAVLTKGKGSNGWQQAQLFRHSILDDSNRGLQINIRLKEP